MYAFLTCDRCRDIRSRSVNLQPCTSSVTDEGSQWVGDNALLVNGFMYISRHRERVHAVVRGNVYGPQRDDRLFLIPYPLSTATL